MQRPLVVTATMSVVTELGTTSGCLSTLGAVCAAYLGLKLTLAIWNIFKTFVLPRIMGHGVDFKKMGEWAGTVIYINIPVAVRATGILYV